MVDKDMEILTVTLPSGTLRRLATRGFAYELEPKDVARFLIEQGVAILERRDPDLRKPPNAA